MFGHMPAIIVWSGSTRRRLPCIRRSNRSRLSLTPFATARAAAISCSIASAGSGTTLIACERTRRKARLIELDPLYCDQTYRRWQKLTGNPPCMRSPAVSSTDIAVVIEFRELTVMKRNAPRKSRIGRNDQSSNKEAPRDYAVGYGRPPIGRGSSRELRAMLRADRKAAKP